MITKLILLCTVVVSKALQIHEFMTDDQVEKVFRVPRHAVPDYEVVPVFHTLHKRSADKEQEIRINAFNRNINLYLKPTEGILFGTNTPVYSVAPDKSQPRGLKYKRLRNADIEMFKAFQDVLTNTAIVILKKKMNRGIQMFGKILNDFFIEPLPPGLKKLFTGTRSVNETHDGFEQTHHHIIFQRPDPPHDEVLRGMKLAKRERTHNNSRTSGSLHPVPDVIYPEILITMDYNLFKTQNEDFKKSMLYLLAFWNAVDLRYRTMSHPRIRLNIAGLIISTANGGTPYIENHKRGKIELDADLALYDMSKYFYEEERFPFSKYDLAVTMTQLDLCNLITSDYCDTSTLGYAYGAGACNRSSIDRNTEAVGLVEDNGGYSAIIPTAHEVAHLLGAPHDGEEESQDCPGYNGFMMTYKLSLGENNFYWSNCSMNTFREFITSGNGTCMYNHPQRGLPTFRVLPGKILTLNEQCKKLYGTSSCQFDESVCTRLDCYLPNSKVCRAQTAAAEGSSCGKNMHCLNGHCVPVDANDLAEPPELAKQQYIPQFQKFNPTDWTSPFTHEH